MNILISASENYLPFAKTMLASLGATNTASVHVYLMYVEMEQKAMDAFSAFVTQTLGMQFTAVAVDYSCFQDMPIGRHYSIEIYNRLLAQDLLPQSLDRILYLDVDLVVRGDLSSFYQQELAEETYLVACVDWNYQSEVMQAHKANLGLPASHRYFNSGVLLLDLAKLRENVTAQDVFAVTKELAPKMKFPDQDILNVMYAQHVVYADAAIYNFQTFDVHDTAFSKENTIIVHYAGIQKPWQWKYINRYSKYYWAVECKQGHAYKAAITYLAAAIGLPFLWLYRTMRSCLR